MYLTSMPAWVSKLTAISVKLLMRHLRALFDTAVASVKPASVFSNGLLKYDLGKLSIEAGLSQHVNVDLIENRGVFVLAFGKASLAMTNSLLREVPT